MQGAQNRYGTETQNPYSCWVAKLVDCPFVGGAGGRRVLLPYTVYKAISGIQRIYSVKISARFLLLVIFLFVCFLDFC
jgi:hypothetical protein